MPGLKRGWTGMPHEGPAPGAREAPVSVAVRFLWPGLLGTTVRPEGRGPEEQVADSALLLGRGLGRQGSGASAEACHASDGGHLDGASGCPAPNR